MNNTILIIIISLCFVGVGILMNYLKQNNKHSNEEISDKIDIAKIVVNFTAATARSMGLCNDTKKLEYIAIDTLEYMRTVNTGNKEVIIDEGIIKAKEMCLVFDIELDEDKEFIIESIVRAGYNLYIKYKNQDFLEENINEK